MFNINTVNDTDVVLKEYYGFSDKEVSTLLEAKKEKLADRVVTMLYKSIKKKAIDLDFTAVDATKGDIEKMPNFKDIKNAIAYLKKIHEKNKTLNSKEMSEVISVLEGTADFLVKHKKSFTTAYNSNNSLCKYLYESSVIGLIQLTSFTVSETMTYVSNGLNTEVKAVANVKNLKKHNALKALKNLVSMEKSNKLDKMLKQSLSVNEAVGMILGTIGLISVALTNVRTLIYLYHMSRIKLSEYLLQLSEFVQLNMASITDADVKQKQEAWVKKLQKLAEKIAIDQNVASGRAEEETRDDDAQLDSTTSDDDDLGIL